MDKKKKETSSLKEQIEAIDKKVAIKGDAKSKANDLTKIKRRRNRNLA